MSEMVKKAPDYSKYTHQFDFYGYSGPSSGRRKVNGVEVPVGEDFRTVERYKEYKDVGMTIYLPQSDARIGVFGNYHGEIKMEDWDDDIWENRRAEWKQNKVFWDRAYEAGLTKIIMADVQIQRWSEVKHGVLLKPADVVIPDGEVSPYTFQSEEEFDDAIAKHLALYIDHPGFYGVMLADEPGYACVEAYGQTYRAIKRVAKNVFKRDIFVQHNLLPMRGYCNGAYILFPLMEWFDDKENTISPKEYYDLVGGVCADDVVSPKEKLQAILAAELAAYNGDRPKLTSAKYEKYLESFALSMGSDYLQFDDYPVRGTQEDPSIIGVAIREMQVAAKVAKKLGIKYYMVTQSYAITCNGRAEHRICSKEDCYWLNNTLLAFGVSQISYFTYFAKCSNAVEHYTLSDGSFITRDGKKTPIYDYYKQIMAENQKFAPTYLNFKCEGGRIFNAPNPQYTDGYLFGEWVDDSYQFIHLLGVDVDKESVLVTELYDQANDNYMYCVQNIVDAARKGVLQATTLTFDSAKYQYAAVYRNGERTLCALNDGKITLENVAGQAAFVIPY